MTTSTFKHWKPGTDLPYVIRLGDEGMLAISLPAAWLKADRTGDPLLLPAAVRAIDRLRALFVDQKQITAGFIVALREAMGLTQEQLARKLNVSKMTVSRWECGRMHPSESAVTSMRRLQARARKSGLIIDGHKKTAA
jgi:DNA-binding transcriptional regulator YiaG